MADISYRPLIEKMTWSFSRLRAFESCPYYWFLRYVRGIKDLGSFYAGFGSLMHTILERYYSGAITKEDMLTEFLVGFSKSVNGERPSSRIVSRYIQSGIDYLSSFEPLPLSPIWVEKHVDFDVGGHPFTGVVDLLGVTESGELWLVDHKSRDLKVRSGRKKQTASDRELDEMLRQLYLYSIPVYEALGRYPDKLCFNCFKSGTFVCEPFSAAAFDAAAEWASSLVESIEGEEDFAPNQEWFFCRWLCGVSDKCVYDEESRE